MSRRSSVLMLGLLSALLSPCGGYQSKSATPDTAASTVPAPPVPAAAVASAVETEASAA
jgi:hypothetical protein